MGGGGKSTCVFFRMDETDQALGKALRYLLFSSSHVTGVRALSVFFSSLFKTERFHHLKQKSGRPSRSSSEPGQRLNRGRAVTVSGQSAVGRKAGEPPRGEGNGGHVGAGCEGLSFPSVRTLVPSFLPPPPPPPPLLSPSLPLLPSPHPFPPADREGSGRHRRSEEEGARERPGAEREASPREWREAGAGGSSPADRQRDGAARMEAPFAASRLQLTTTAAAAAV